MLRAGAGGRLALARGAQVALESSPTNSQGFARGATPTKKRATDILLKAGTHTQRAQGLPGGSGNGNFWFFFIGVGGWGGVGWGAPVLTVAVLC